VHTTSLVLYCGNDFFTRDLDIGDCITLMTKMRHLSDYIKFDYVLQSPIGELSLNRRMPLCRRAA